jgi:hypothetical protein
MEDKIYCGNGRILKTKFGEIPKISMSKKDINEIVKYMKGNNLEWVNLEMLEKKTKEEGKATHYLKIDTFKPEKQDKKAELKIKSEDDLPF